MKKNILMIICTAVVVLGVNSLFVKPKECPVQNIEPIPGTTNGIRIDTEGLKILRPNGEVLYTVDHPHDSIDPDMFREIISRSSDDNRFALILQSAYEGESYGIVDTLTGEYRNLIHGGMDDIVWSPRERILMMASFQDGMEAPSGLYFIDLRTISTLNLPEFAVRNIAAEIGYQDMNFKTVAFSADGKDIYFTYSPTWKDFKQASTSVDALTQRAEN